MTLQRKYREGGKPDWRDVIEYGEAVKSPVDIDALPVGVSRKIGKYFFNHESQVFPEKISREKSVIIRAEYYSHRRGTLLQKREVGVSDLCPQT